jgi:hypothetical protein
LHDDDTYVDPGAIATTWGSFDPLMQALAMMSRTLSLRNRLLSDQKSLDPQEEPIIIQNCLETLDDFHRWDAEAAMYWQNTFEGRTTPTALGEVASGTTHYDAETACTIILVRSERLILLMSMIAYHFQRQHCGVDTGLGECIPLLELHVSMAIDDILASVPYALGDIGPGGVPASPAHDGAGAIVIVQSIRLVASCAYASPDQLARAIGILGRLNAEVGIRAAAGAREEDVSGTRWMREQKFLCERMVLVSPPALAMAMSLSPNPGLESDVPSPSVG